MLQKFYLFRELKTEVLKYRGTLVYWLMVLCPFAIVFFIFIANSFDGAKSLVKMVEEGKNPWKQYIVIHYRVIAILLLPLYIAMINGMIYGREHRNNTWKHLYTQPVPRWSIELSKNIFSLVVLLMTLLLFSVMIAVSGYAVSLTNPKLNLAKFDNHFAYNIMTAVKVFLSVLGIWSIHNWIGRRFSSFGYNIGLALIGVVSGSILVQGWKYVQYYPYAFPTLTVLNPKEMQVFFNKSVTYSLIACVVFWGLGFWDIHRKKIRA